MCIRPEAGFCCVQYMVCSDPDSFSLNSMAAAGTPDAAAQDSSCTLDYIDIPGMQNFLLKFVFYKLFANSAIW